MLRRFSPPIHTHPYHKRLHGVDMWDFVLPGPPEEEQEVLNKIYSICKEWDALDNKATHAKDEIIIRAGFRNDRPAKYQYFIACFGAEAGGCSCRSVCVMDEFWGTG